MLSKKIDFSKDNIDFYLKEVAKEYKKVNKTGPEAEIILVGGAATLINYNFRDITTDIDGIIIASSAFKDVINKVGDKYNLPNGWLNSDFIKTMSYSPKLYEHSKFYKSFYGALSVRTIDAEYMVAMKLISGRIYKKDLSDIVGVVGEQKKIGKPLTYNKIYDAVIELYGNWDRVGSDAKNLLDRALSNENIEELYESLREEEIQNRDALLKAEEDYSKELKESNVNQFIEYFKRLNDTKKYN